MKVFNVYNTEDHVGSFLQATFSTFEKAQDYINATLYAHKVRYMYDQDTLPEVYHDVTLEEHMNEYQLSILEEEIDKPVTVWPTLLEWKIQTMPHPWFGDFELRSFDRTSGAAITLLTLGEKQAIWPDSPCMHDREVRMTKAQLKQMLAGNRMLPGEEEMRMSMLSSGS